MNDKPANTCQQGHMPSFYSKFLNFYDCFSCVIKNQVSYIHHRELVDFLEHQWFSFLPQTGTASTKKVQCCFWYDTKKSVMTVHRLYCTNALYNAMSLLFCTPFLWNTFIS